MKLRQPNPTSKRNALATRRNEATYSVLEPRQLLAADTVVQWNEILLGAIRGSATPPPAASRAMAMVHTAIFDAVNSIQHEYQPYLSVIAAHPKASLDAAVAAAAERVLSSLFPAMQATFSGHLAASLAAIPDGLRENQGVAAGQAAANQILAWRAADGASAVVNYVPGNGVGQWRPTAPGFLPGAFPQWPGVLPWAMTTGNEFRPPAPIALDSDEYAAACSEVQSLGALNSSVRTAEQSDIAKIWAGGPGTATPPGQWNMIAQDIAESQGYSLVQNARMFALLNVALADATIAAWDAKYEYNFWRPITAIQLADQDGNPNTVQDSTWTPMLTTPPFSAYISGHSTFSGAASTVLQQFVGSDQIQFELRSEVNGIADRAFSSLRTAAEEAGMSRIYGGIHFQFDNQWGLVTGRQIGSLVAHSKLGLATVASAVQDGNRLYIQGTTLSDKLFVQRVGSHLVVWQNGKEVGAFSSLDIAHVVVAAGAGNDRVDFAHNVLATAEMFGGSGNDKLFGSRTANWLYGEEGDDILCGGAGADLLRGGSGNDKLFGLAGADQLFADDGFDLLCGGSGNDTLTGKRGRDKLMGGSGHNLIHWI